MARPKKIVEVPGQETKTDEIDTTLENSLITPRNPLSEFAEGVNAIANSPAGAELANTAAELNAATAGATVITETTAPIVGIDPGQGDSTAVVTVQQRVAKLLGGAELAERNAMLSTLPAAGLEIITRFEAYGFTDEVGHPLTNNLDFLSLVRKATASQVAVSAPGTDPTLQGIMTATEAMRRNEDGARKALTKPVLTKNGWHVPE